MAFIAMTEKDLDEIVAYHEAGHAVMAIQYGRTVKEICITSPGAGYISSQHKALVPRGSDTASARDRLVYLMDVIAYVKMLLAGPVAECEFCRLPTRGPGSPRYTDHDVAWEILCHPSVRDLFEQYAPRGIEGLQADVDEWVVKPEIWHTIRVLAESLVDQRRMGWGDIQDLLVSVRSHKSQFRLF